jgi:hypothetical protein
VWGLHNRGDSAEIAAELKRIFVLLADWLRGGGAAPPSETAEPDLEKP